MKYISSFLIYVTLIMTFADCSKKEAEIPPTPAAIEGYSWQLKSSSTIYQGKEFYSNLDECAQSVKWTFKSGVIIISYSPDCKNSFYVTRNNNDRYTITDGNINHYSPSGSTFYYSRKLSFSGNKMTWTSGPDPYVVEDEGGRMIFEHQ